MLTGDHHIRLLWNMILLPRCPLIGHVDTVTSPTNALLSAPLLTATSPEKVILTGQGLQTATVNQEAEFVIDGTEAAPGN